MSLVPMSRTESYIAGCNFKVSFIPPWYQAFCCSLLVESFYFHKLLSHYYAVTRKSIKSQQREEKKVVPALGRHAGSERARSHGTCAWLQRRRVVLLAGKDFTGAWPESKAYISLLHTHRSNINNEASTSDSYFFP